MSEEKETERKLSSVKEASLRAFYYSSKSHFKFLYRRSRILGGKSFLSTLRFHVSQNYHHCHGSHLLRRDRRRADPADNRAQPHALPVSRPGFS